MFLIFSLGEEEYGIDIKHVIEIIGMQSITIIPQMPEYVKGVINLRGKIIPIMDVRCRFNKDLKEYHDRTCIIVVEIGDLLIGLVVDSVCEVLTIGEESIALPPKINNGFHHKYINGIGKIGEKIKLLLDCEKLIEEDELSELKEIYE